MTYGALRCVRNLSSVPAHVQLRFPDSRLSVSLRTPGRDVGLRAGGTQVGPSRPREPSSGPEVSPAVVDWGSSVARGAMFPEGDTPRGVLRGPARPNQTPCVNLSLNTSSERLPLGSRCSDGPTVSTCFRRRGRVRSVCRGRSVVVAPAHMGGSRSAGPLTPGAGRTEAHRDSTGTVLCTYDGLRVGVGR